MNKPAKINRIFLLMAEFGTADIPLEMVAPKYLGLNEERIWKRRAAMHELPFPAFRADSQKAPWIVSAAALAEYLDKREEHALRDWRAAS